MYPDTARRPVAGAILVRPPTYYFSQCRGKHFTCRSEFGPSNAKVTRDPAAQETPLGRAPALSALTQVRTTPRPRPHQAQQVPKFGGACSVPLRGDELPATSRTQKRGRHERGAAQRSRSRPSRRPTPGPVMHGTISINMLLPASSPSCVCSCLCARACTRAHCVRSVPSHRITSHRFAPPCLVSPRLAPPRLA